MADAAHNTRAHAWANAYANYRKLNERLVAAPASERDALERAIAAQEEDLLDTEAPHLTAVRHKLEFLWSAELHGVGGEAEYKRLILEDLESLTADLTALVH